MTHLPNSYTRDLCSGTMSILSGDICLPTAILSLSKLNANIAWMQEFADSNGVKLSPHGKTTMCPTIFDKQLNAGAWAMTLATAAQVTVAANHGVERVILANQLVGFGNMSTVSMHLDAIEFYCIVDSIDNVTQLANFYQNKNQQIQVLIEIGVGHGRTGCRTTAEVSAIETAISKSDNLLLAGIEVYEGVIHNGDAESDVTSLLNRAIDTTKTLIAQNAFDTDEIILTGAGSAWYDQVTKQFTTSNLPDNVVPVIRPGSYVIHDTGMYDAFQDTVLDRSTTARKMPGKLQNCLEVVAYVQSIPEEGLAIIAMGKRDIGFSDGLPSPEWRFRIGSDAQQPALQHWEVFELMDQHTFMRTKSTDDLKVGDMIGFSASHPCLTCDKWREFVIVDDNLCVMDRWPTFF